MEENYNAYERVLDPSTIYAILAVALIFGIIGMIAQWKIFSKAGKPGWAAIVPIYNVYTLLKVVGKPGWWLFLLLVPFVNIYVAIKSVHLLSKSFGKGVGFTLGLLFLPIAFYPVLAFGSAAYLGPYGDPAAFAARQQANQFDFENLNA
ncbi:DUF5684 domain-containing protein [Flavisolibacter nicotianae]|uniref:DUF5684 domain-containing protein n=1 Tax=Flavisolibacter nicotianae TaxID=2364882 RepID=UPI000EAB708D|nr:DUF5684 domain-containing protein [Flavisolibacter nicotianae]